MKKSINECKIIASSLYDINILSEGNHYLSSRDKYQYLLSRLVIEELPKYSINQLDIEDILNIKTEILHIIRDEK